jgi:RNA polymerase sigma-70 factor (ECF subfamily)
MLEDQWLLMRFKRGSDEAFSRIYAKYRAFLLRLAVAMLHDPQSAEDVVHDVFLHLVQFPQRIALGGSLKAFLRTCVLNGVRSRMRREKVRSHVQLNEGLAGDARRPDQWVVFDEESQRVLAALAQVPVEQREAVVLRLHGDMTFRQIAAMYGVPIATVQSRYRYGLDKLRSIMNGKVSP